MDEWSLEDHWIRLSQAPARVGVSRQTIHNWIQKGKIRTLQPARTIWVSVIDLLAAEKESNAARRN